MIQRYRRAKRARRKKASRERQDARGAFFEQAAETVPYLGIDTDHGSYVVLTSDEQVGRSLIAKGSRPEFRMLDRAVSVVDDAVGDVRESQFIDVGANIGTEVIPALIRHGFGDAVAIEPDVENYRMLRVNLALNGVASQVVSLRIAASDKKGDAILSRATRAGGLSFLAMGDAGEVGEKGWERTEVQTITLDELAGEKIIRPAHVGMLWVDVEGHEAQVLAGASELTGMGVPVLVEYHPESLQGRGDLDLFESIATDCYTHVVDIRRSGSKPENWRRRPIADLAAITEALCDPSRTSFTDLLLLRLDG